MRKNKTAVLLALLFSVTACSTSGTSVLIGEHGVFPSTDPGAVTLLIAPPEKKHTIIALVEGVAATDDYFTKAKTEAAAITAMKEEAARIGANAIVLNAKGSQPYGQVSVGNSTVSAYGSPASINAYGTSVSSSMGWEKITFNGTAIRYTEQNK
ncbi:hypothetical protein D3C75_583110 [compost metagenome]